MTVDEIELKMKGLDKRTKYYKELKLQLESIRDSVEDNSLPSIELQEDSVEDTVEDKYQVDDDIYKVVKAFNKRVPANKVKWLFNTYNRLFNQNIKMCLCPGIVKKMIVKIIKTYEKERR
jgi:hypothetical protein